MVPEKVEPLACKCSSRTCSRCKSKKRRRKHELSGKGIPIPARYVMRGVGVVVVLIMM